MNQTTPTYLMKTKPFVYEKRAMQAPRTATTAMVQASRTAMMQWSLSPQEMKEMKERSHLLKHLEPETESCRYLVCYN